ncbi:hypothetical protein VSS37_18590 [Candidatus Thiothrix sp. Deng01]|uniref:Uncharacterized protein n=1 Tax=Candidatus Thiothrix phosphatis TaxID=3112415 RepID=A0ABU6D1R7_9GAMM|nr:hypothetical protein [Candidatus Thiothrix sp. Deng01]MEB4592995.1 hypothetical protein [Candidatus Thiothrix sp. Deng01]
MPAKYLALFILPAVFVVPVSLAANASPATPTPMAWSSQSEGMQVYTLPDGRYHAEINYQDSGGDGSSDSQSFSFEGSPAEIRAQIQASNALPKEKKQALLQSLNMQGALFNQAMPDGKPFGEHFLKNPPTTAAPANGSLFDEQFFQELFKAMPALTPPASLGQSAAIAPVPVKPAAKPTPADKSGQGKAANPDKAPAEKAALKPQGQDKAKAAKAADKTKPAEPDKNKGKANGETKD